MATFNVEAMDAKGKTATVTIEAASVPEAVVRARERGLFAISVRRSHGETVSPLEAALSGTDDGTTAAPPVSLYSVPDGFALQHDKLGGTLHITYRSRGMGETLRAVSLWFFLWTIGGVVAWWLVLRARLLVEAGPGVLLAVPLCWWAYWEWRVVFYLAWHLFGRTLAIMGPDELRIQKRLCGWTRTQTVRKDDIGLIWQSPDGSPFARGLVVFRARGLSAETIGKALDGGDLSAVRRADRIGLLWQEPKEKSDWLGSLLSRWSGKDCRPSGSLAAGSKPSSGGPTEPP